MRTDVLLDLLHELHIVLRHERHGLARAARAARPAHAVHIPEVCRSLPLASYAPSPQPLHPPGQRRASAGPVPVPVQGVSGQCQCRASAG